MSDVRPPDFDDLVDADIEAAERARLRRAHDLLVAAGPPPDLADRPVRILDRPRRRPWPVAIAATLGLLVLAIGFVLGDRADDRSVDFVVAMAGTGAAAEASAELLVFDLDAAGNWPMELQVEGLRPSTEQRYQLWLTRGGELAELCGSFLAEAEGTTVVPMNAPWRFDEFDGWVVVEEGSEEPLLKS